MKQPLVSVIIPTYNSEKYIKKCLKSVLAQTYTNFELIVVDDGSTDKTFQICNKFAEADSRLKCISIVHSGVSQARNAGIDNASGELVTFFDADDYPESSILEEYVKAVDMWGDSVSFILSGMIWENHNDRLVPREKHVLEPIRGYREGQLYLLQNHDVSMISWNKLFNFITNKCYFMAVIKDNNVRFNEEIHIAEDMLFNLDYLDVAKGFIGVINKPLYHYVKHGHDSLSAAYYDGAIEHVCKSFDRLLEFALKQPGVTKDDEYVIDSIYLMDWVSRLSAFMEDTTNGLGKKERYKLCNEELKKPKFRSILRDSRKGRKIDAFRYFVLRYCRFQMFYFMRKMYHRVRKEKRDFV